MKVLLVDDHPLILKALHSVIGGLGEGVEVVNAASAAQARQALAAAADFDLVLLDLLLGDADGFDLLVELRQRHPALPVVVVSASDRASDVIRAIDLGAMGYVPKRASNDTLVEALRLVMSGGVYVPPITLGGAAPPPGGTAVVGGGGGGNGSGGLGVAALAGAAGFQRMPALAQVGLTPRQTEVLGKLLQGKPNKLIARELNLSVETVKDHVAAVLRALGVSSRTQAVIAVGQMAREGGSGRSGSGGGPGGWRGPV